MTPPPPKILAVAATAVAGLVPVALPLPAAAAPVGPPLSGATALPSGKGATAPAGTAGPTGRATGNNGASAGSPAGTGAGGEATEPGGANGTGPTGTGAGAETDEAVKDPRAGFQQGATLGGEPRGDSGKGGKGSPSGGVTAGTLPQASAPATEAPPTGGAGGALPAPTPSEALAIPNLPASTCAATGVPPLLIPIYQRAAAAYGLGPQGPAVLAGINEVETAFGTNLNVSSAGAVGWMQFMPSTWATYGVDANGDGVKDPYNPEDAIFAAAGYLSAAGMPADTYAAIYAYNHADWYVAEVLANAGCYAAAVGAPNFTEGGLQPQIKVFRCEAAPAWKRQIPAAYLSAFEAAAGRYELGRRGVWALAAVARLESNFGRGMDKRQLHREGPLGLDPSEWKAYAVDGNEDGRVRHGDIVDSAATLAREIWSRGGLGAGLFFHNQAEWYVQEVLEEAEGMEGGCQVRFIDWRVAPLGTGFETAGEAAVLDGNLASAPRSAPPAVKAAIAAANSISSTPYVWGGGHASFYSSGYDCSGAVSFALYGAGLLDAPLTSGSLESYGEAGPGKWITIYANATHTYAVIAGLRWDTVGDSEGSGPRWHQEPPYPEGFVVRHPPGY